MFVLGVRGKGKVSDLVSGRQGREGGLKEGEKGARGRPSSHRRRTVNAGALFLLCPCVGKYPFDG